MNSRSTTKRPFLVYIHRTFTRAALRAHATASTTAPIRSPSSINPILFSHQLRPLHGVGRGKPSAPGPGFPTCIRYVYMVAQMQRAALADGSRINLYIRHAKICT